MGRNMLKEPYKYGHLMVHDTTWDEVVAEEVGLAANPLYPLSYCNH